MQLSHYQSNILEALNTTTNNLQISGVAGCGKTTTLQLICEQLRIVTKGAKILYIAFNNEICSDVEPKLAPYDAKVKTFHKLGLAAIRNSGMKVKVDAYKYRNMINEDIKKLDGGENRFDGLYPAQITKLTEILRLWYVPITEDSVIDALDHINFEYSDFWLGEHLAVLTDRIKKYVKQGLADKNVIDFVDMLLFPVAHKLPLEYFTHVLIDECQDLSPLMHQFVKFYNGRQARIIAVGDPYQAIYQFAGADSDSFAKLGLITKAVQLPLSVCYRCPDEIIEMAKKYVPHIEGTGKTGIIENLTQLELLEKCEQNDLILCRRNAPLLSLMFKLLASGKPAIIKGNGFVDYLKSLVKKIEKIDKNFSLFLENLDDYVTTRIEKMRDDDKIQMYLDAQECLILLYEEAECNSYSDLNKAISRLFTVNDGDEENRIVLSSFHRSKGLQKERVHILLDKPLAKPATGCQESNLAYVALTRSLHYLSLVKG